MNVTIQTNGPASYISSTPRQAADVRLTMMSSWHETGLSMDLLRHLAQERPEYEQEHGPVDVDRWSRSDLIKDAELVWVAPQMCDLLASAVNTMPDSEVGEFTPNIICIFGSEMARLLGDANLPLHALHWHGGICDTYIIDVLGRAACVCSSSTSRLHTQSQQEAMRSDVKLLMALHALMASPGVTESRREPIDRAGRRRAKRVGVDDPTVRVIYLRSARSEGGDGTGEQRYHHQWIVSGHWRQQAHGPARSLRRLTWVAPHLKGPPDAPLLTGDKVKALVR